MACPPEFQVLLRWWLGLPQRQTPRERATCHSDSHTVTMSQSSILWALPVTSHKIVSPMPSFPNTVTTTSYAAMQADRSMLVGFLILEVRPRMLNWSCGKSSNALRKYMARRKATFSATRQQKGLSFPSCAGGSSAHRSNFLRRISYRPKRSSGDTAGGPARC